MREYAVAEKPVWLEHKEGRKHYQMGIKRQGKPFRP